MKHLFICLLLGLTLSACERNGVHYSTGTIQEVFAKAQKENKKVFVLIGSSQCGRCTIFANFLDSQSTTVNILKNNYVCYKVDIHDPTQKTIAQIAKCPSYPFPYFFDKEGNLEAFGFPNSKEYDISDLTKIGIDEYRFKEMFRLYIPTNTYKSLVSLNLRAFLLASQPGANRQLLDSAYNLVNRSLDIAAYPYNLWFSYQLANQLGYKRSEVARPLPVETHSDQVLYGSLLDSVKRINPVNLPVYSGTDDSIQYSFLKDKLDCGSIKKGTDYSFSFELKNTGKKDLLIARAEHPCSCVELQWPQQAIRPGETDFINGIFHAREKGSFSKDIYVHTASPQVPMKIIVLTGNVF